jgi:NADH dehydrogenase
MDRTVIITGANGYLGKYVCMQLLEKGYHVIGLTYPHWASVKLIHPRITYVHCDIRHGIMDQEGIAESVKNRNIAGIINAAALLGSANIEDNRAVNAAGVQNMMDFARRIDVRKFIQISSVVVMKKIKGPYGITKLEGQKMLEESDLDYTVFIPAMILGPESLGINRILKNVFRFPLVVPLIGYGKQTQHPIFVKDFARAIVASISSENTGRKTYQIAGDTVISFKDLIRLILDIRKRRKLFIPIPPSFARLLGRFFQAIQKVPVFTAEHVKGIMQDSKLDTSMLKTDLDFRPTPLEEALKYTLDVIGKDWDYYLSPREEKEEIIK